MHTHTHICMHVCTHMHMLLNFHTPMHTCMQTHTHARTHACTHARTHTHTYTHVCIRAYAYACIHAHAYARIHLYIHILIWKSLKSKQAISMKNPNIYNHVILLQVSKANYESFCLLFESSIKLSNGSPFIRNQIHKSMSERSEREIFFVRYFRVKS